VTGQVQLAEIFESLQRVGMEEAEIYLKSGRSRRFEIGIQGKAGSSSVERGWAIRAGSSRAAMFIAGTGLPRANLKWPQPDGQPLRLPAASPIPPWRSPPDFDTALVAESEAVALLSGIDSALAREVPGSHMILGQLEEGTSETAIVSTHGIDVDYRTRAASLFVEAVGPWQGSASATLSLAARDHRLFQSTAIAKRLANRLLLTRQGAAPSRERGDVLVGSAVAARLLASLLPLLLGAEAETLARRFRDRQGRLGSGLLTIIDDGRLNGGVLASPVDGEGLPTGPVVLIEEGRYRQPLVDWRQSGGESRPVFGCARRESWRDLPQTSPSHLYLQPRSEVGVGELLSSVTRGYYLLEPLGPGIFDFERDHFRLPVCGFVLRQGQATAPLSRTWVEGGISAFLRNIRAVARDLSFQPLGAMIGAPSLLISGLGVRSMD
jgi:predicted Zn-dependent protease